MNLNATAPAIQPTECDVLVIGGGPSGVHIRMVDDAVAAVPR